VKPFIESIAIRNIRGIKDITLDLRNNTILVGENGAGKSSVVDAIELLFTGKIQRLMSRQDINTEESIGFNGNAGDISVNFCDDPAPLNLTYPGKTITNHKWATPYSTSGQFILRRATLLRFVESRESERYNEISALIGISAVDKIEAAWKKKVNDLRKPLDDFERRALSALVRLGELLESPVLNEHMVSFLINKKLEAFQISPVFDPNDMPRVLQQLQKELDSRPPSREYMDYKDTRQRLSEIDRTIKQGKEKLQTFLAKSIELSNLIGTKDDPNAEHLLGLAYKYLQTTPQDSCPVCEQGVPSRIKLVERLKERLNLMQSATNKSAEHAKADEEYKQQITILGNFVEKVLIEVPKTTFTELIDPSIISEFRDGLITLKENPAVAASKLDRFEFLLNAMDEHLERKKATLIEDPSVSVAALLKAMSGAKEQWEMFRDNDKQNLLIKTQLAKAELIYDTLVETRKRGVDRILDELGGSIYKYYQILHPDEGNRQIVLKGNEQKNKGIELKAEKSGTHAMHPMGIFSEGHLDSLGLCIFLAFIRHYNEGFNFIVLDDILTSIDAGHRLRVANLLMEEFQNFQFLITTHDDFWAEELSNVFKNHGKGNRALTYKMLPWTPTEGAKHDQYKFKDLFYYQNMVAQGNNLDAVSGAGRTFEGFLKQMRINLRLAIPAKYGERYTIHDLIEKFFEWIETHPFDRTDTPKSMKELRAIMDRLRNIWFIRNVSGAHATDIGGKVSSAEVMEFIDAAEELMDHFSCPVCHNFVQIDKEGFSVHCYSCANKDKGSLGSQWRYQPQWRNRLPNDNALALDERTMRKIVNRSKSTIMAIIQDSRKRLSLAVAANLDDTFETAEILQAMLTFLTDHPRDEGTNFRSKFEKVNEMLTHWIDTQGNWVHQNHEFSHYKEFLSLADLLSELISCPNCGTMLIFDRKNGKYQCTQCDLGMRETQAGARWVLLKKNKF
jgi:hypothetical protein